MLRVVAVLVGLALLAATLNGVAVLVGGPPHQSPWRPVGQIVLLAGAWLLADSAYEGRVLWVPLPQHGLTLADLAVLPPLAVALLVALLQGR